MTNKSDIGPQLWAELEGVLADYRLGAEFNDVSVDTIKRVQEQMYLPDHMLEAFKKLPIDEQRRFVHNCMLNYQID